MALSKVVELNGVDVTQRGNRIPSDETGGFLDSDWAKSAFLISDSYMSDADDIANRYWSSADAKFTDGRLGCNIGINPKPQFTRYSDIRARGRDKERNAVSLTNVNGNYGMGRYYSEAIDDPSQTIYMRFGVPQFSGLMSFLSRAYDAEQISLARTGRASSLLFKGAQALGTITTVYAFPLLAAGVVLGNAIGFLFSRPSSKFYTMKPTMHTYWSSVNALVENITVAKGILPKVLQDDGDKGERLGQPYKIDSEHLAELSRLMPDVFGGTLANRFDIVALATRAQRAANRQFSKDYDSLNKGSASDYTGYLKKEITGTGAHSTYISNDDGKTSLVAILNKAFLLADYKRDNSTPAQETNPSSYERPKDKDGNYLADLPPAAEQSKLAETRNRLAQYFDAEFRDGSQFAAFKVDFTGAVQESFGNSVQESDLSSKINGVSSSMKQARFTFAEGNITGGIVGDVIGGIAGAASDVVTGALSGITLGFSDILRGLGGAGYIDIPKHWQSSSATLPRSSYTMQLISPYGNPISQLQNIYIPLAMILAGTLPLSTGKASYTSPFLCQLFDRGRCQVKLGMIESLSISRGTSNLAFNAKGSPLAIDVTFTVADLSSIMHMPVSSGGLFSVDTNLDDDNIMADYIAVLAGQDLYSQVYAFPKAKLKFAKIVTAADRLFSPAHYAAAIHDMMPGPVLNVIEALNRGSSVISGSISQ